MVEPLLVSLCYFAYVVLLCEIGRSLSRAFIREDSTLSLMEEFLGTLQMCAILLENGFILTKFGLTVFAIVLFGQYFLHSYTLRRAYANPSPLFELFLNGRCSSLEFVSKLACQLAAAFLAFRMAQVFWALEMTDEHRTAYANFYCYSHLQVSVAFGFCCEMVAALVFRFCSLKFEKYLQPKVAQLLEAILIVWLVITGLNYTGMYFNPILATANNYGCRNVRTFEHLTVYWLGPIVGWILATRLHYATTSP